MAVRKGNLKDDRSIGDVEGDTLFHGSGYGESFKVSPSISNSI